MRFIYAVYNVCHNCIDETTFDGYILNYSSSQCALDALAMDEPLEYARLALDDNLQM